MFVFHGLEAQRGINCGGGGTPLLLIFAMLGRRALGGALPVSILNLLEYGSADNSNGWAHDFIGTILTMPLFIGSSRNCCHTSCCNNGPVVAAKFTWGYINVKIENWFLDTSIAEMCTPTVSQHIYRPGRGASGINFRCSFKRPKEAPDLAQMAKGHGI